MVVVYEDIMFEEFFIFHTLQSQLREFVSFSKQFLDYVSFEIEATFVSEQFN